MEVMFIIAAIQTILWGITFYLLVQKDKRQEKDIECLKKQTIDQQLEIQHLNDKLWKDSKLTKVIVEAVATSMTKWENKMLKSGFIHNHDRDIDKP